MKNKDLSYCNNLQSHLSWKRIQIENYSWSGKLKQGSKLDQNINKNALNMSKNSNWLLAQYCH